MSLAQTALGVNDTLGKIGTIIKNYYWLRGKNAFRHLVCRTLAKKTVLRFIRWNVGVFSNLLE